MKTQIIKLDSHDDVISIRDKMSWAKTERILLIFPRRLSLLMRNIDLLLLRRHAAELGAQLGIVARSNELRRLAQGGGPARFLDRRQGPARSLGAGSPARATPPARSASRPAPDA